MSYILIADDNHDITEILSVYAKKENFEPVIAHDGEEAFSLFEKYKPTIVLLDIMMPKNDGFNVCRKIREVSNTPVILITARGEEFEKIMGLDIGADDYIVKPFSPKEIMARVRAILRRRIHSAEISNNEKNINPDSYFSSNGLEINIEEYSLSIDKEKLSLSRKEIETMWLLVKNPNKVFTRDNLLDSLWGYDYFGDSRTVDSHIKRLRKKLDKYNHPKWDIKTIWGVGYKFEQEK